MCTLNDKGKKIAGSFTGVDQIRRNYAYYTEKGFQ
jgi:hypothetical protein